MNDKQVRLLLAGLPLTGADAARLILEAVEEMPALRAAAARGKSALIPALRRVLREGIASLLAQEKTVSFSHAAEESLARRAGRRPTTLRDLRYFIHRLLRVPGLAKRPLRDISTEECRRVLEQAFAGSAHSFRKGRAILHSIFVYGQRQQWCSHNPVSVIEVPAIEEKEIVPLSLAECRRLVEVAQTPRFRSCLPALGLMLFAGVRPGEVARLRWADIHCDEGVLSISARHSKTGGARRVELCPPLRRMLRQQHPAKPEGHHSLLCPPQWQKLWRGLRQAAGLATPRHRWVPDVLRHTFASYHALTHRNLPALQLQLGHRDCRLLQTRYLNLPALRRAEIAPFWSLLDSPPRSPAPCRASASCEVHDDGGQDGRRCCHRLPLHPDLNSEHERELWCHPSPLSLNPATRPSRGSTLPSAHQSVHLQSSIFRPARTG